MRKLATQYLVAGMKAARPIITADGQFLIREGMELNEKYIQKIKEMGIPSVYVEDSDIPSRTIVDIISCQSRAEAMKTLKDFIFNVNEHPTIKAQGINSLIPLINNLVEELILNKEKCVKFLDIRSVDDYTYAHSVNVCILSLVTGLSLNYSQEQLRTLGLAALLHDIGKIKVSPEVVNKKGIFTPEDRQDMEQHPYFGYRLVLSDPSVPTEVAEIIYQHHERYNGSGYPKGLKGNEILESAYIIGVADVYDALTADRIYRKKYLPHEAIEFLYGAGDYYFDYKIIEAFVANIALYPIGTMVELNNRERGIVVDFKPQLSCRPVIKIISDAKGQKPSELKIRDLTVEPTLLITKVFD